MLTTDQETDNGCKVNTLIFNALIFFFFALKKRDIQPKAVWVHFFFLLVYISPDLSETNLHVTEFFLSSHNSEIMCSDRSLPANMPEKKNNLIRLGH